MTIKPRLVRSNLSTPRRQQVQPSNSISSATEPISSPPNSISSVSNLPVRHQTPSARYQTLSARYRTHQFGTKLLHVPAELIKNLCPRLRYSHHIAPPSLRYFCHVASPSLQYSCHIAPTRLRYSHHYPAQFTPTGVSHQV